MAESRFASRNDMNFMQSISWTIGDVKITSLIEIEDAGKVIQEGIPNATKENISQISWLRPHFADDTGNLKAFVQAFVVETKDSRIIVDPCVGNSKLRKSLPAWNNLQTNFLDRLEKAGYKREDIDRVFCTHLHFDHVGWNTMLQDQKWIPTFLRARYLFAEKEFNYWKDHPEREVEDDHAGIRDSVMPVFEAGLVDLIPEDYSISEEISLFPTFGHTPFHVSALIKSDGKQAVITGDVLHHPCQIAYPEWETLYDTDKEQARNSRRALLEHFAETDTLIIGSHFAAPTAGYVRRDKNGFRFI